VSKLGCKITAKSQIFRTLSKFFFQQVKDRHLLFFVIKWHENSVVNLKLFFFIRILLKGTVLQNLINTKKHHRQVKIETRVVHPNFFYTDLDPTFYSIRIWIHKIIESGSNANPDSQQKILFILITERY
jgi:hypothetical protein